MLIAERTGAEIVSVDSVQVYRGMDIGTAKPTAADRSRATHHLIDIVEPEAPFSVAEFKVHGRSSMADIAARGARVLIVGGSGLHFRSLVDPLEFPPADEVVRAAVEALAPESAVAELLLADPEAAAVVALDNPRRVIRALEIHRLTGLTPTERSTSPAARAVRAYRSEIEVAVVAVDPGDLLPDRVGRRFDAMIDAGFDEEVRGLQGRLGPTASTAVGYRELMRAVTGEWEFPYARKRAIEATTALARRQRTFHRRDPRVTWLEWDDDPSELAAAAMSRLEEAGWTS
jgi:tRNA dimethylallyltransferase